MHAFFSKKPCTGFIFRRAPQIGLLSALAIVFISILPAHSAQVDRNVQRARANNEAVMIVAGRPDSSMMKIVDDLAVVFQDFEKFRVVPVVGDGAAGNVRDVVLLRNIDLAVTDFTALKHMRQSQGLSKMLSREIAHVVTLFPEKLSLLSRNNIRDINDLEGKRVSVGLRQSGSALHAKNIFDAVGVKVNTVHMAPSDSAQALDNGDIDAFLCFCLASPGIYQKVMFNPDLHILPIPFAQKLQDDYLPDALAHEEFPSFIGKEETVNTVAVTLTLVTYNWKKGNPRYARVEKFVKHLFQKLPELQKSPRHKGWRSVLISATAPDWPRFAAVEEWQKKQNAGAMQEMRVAFGEFLNRWEPTPQPVQQSAQTQLFEEFLDWRANAQ